jgi:RNA polymerase sigma-70 factor (ECF subfamily)
MTRPVVNSARSAHDVLADPDVGNRVAAELAAARRRWPDAAVTDHGFSAALATRLAAQADPVTALAHLRVDDLFLAQWCATGDARAIAAFERVHRSELDAVFGRFRQLAVTDDEMRQALRIKLFVGSAGKTPRIADYSGFGFLQNWVRVTALRSLVDLARSERARKLEELFGDDDMLALVAHDSIDNRYTRDQINRAIKQAFARAISALAPRERNFLRHAHVDALTLDQIAALYRIHRATVARTLAQARETMMIETRRELAEHLGLADEQLESIVRAADSRIDLSLSRVLRAPELAEGSADP